MTNDLNLTNLIQDLQKLEMGFYFKDKKDECRDLMTKTEADAFEKLICDLEVLLLQNICPKDVYKTIIGHIKTIERTTYSNTDLYKKAQAMLHRIEYLLMPFYSREEFELKEREKFRSSMYSLDQFVSEPQIHIKSNEDLKKLEEYLSELTVSANFIGVSNSFFYKQLWYKLSIIREKSLFLSKNPSYRISNLLEQYEKLSAQ